MLIIAYTIVILFLSETFLNSDISSDNENLDIPGHRFVRSDHPCNYKQGGICVYFKSSLPILKLSISMLHELIKLEITIDGKLCNLICLYSSPSQNMEEFENFVKNLEFNLGFIFNENLYLTVVIGDLNTKSHNSCKGDKTTASGSKLEIMSSHYGLSQIINELTYILEDSSSCIDLVFTSQPNVALDSGVHSSLHPSSHHRIVFAIILRLTKGKYCSGQKCTCIFQLGTSTL